MLLTPSMPSTLITGHHNVLFPPMKSFFFNERGYQGNEFSPRGKEDRQLRSHHQQGVTGKSSAAASTEPWSKMNGAHGNARAQPSLFDNRQLDTIPLVGSNAPPYPTPQNSNSSHSRRRSGLEPFYNNYYSARQKSPIVKKEPESSHQQAGQRRASGDAIASYLQIPSSINSSKGSLPEFAAQVTCLFWFDGSKDLHSVEDTRLSLPIPREPLPADAKPSTGFLKWVITILSMTQVSQNVILLALMFIHRLKKYNPGVKGKLGSEYRLFTVALMLGNKFLDDNTYTNKTWADVSGISVGEIHIMEVEFLSNMRYSLYASEAEWDRWHIKLGRFADYYEKALLLSPVSPSQSVILPTSRYSTPTNLPSPPVSHHSPLSMSQTSPSNSGAPHPLSMPPYLPTASAISSASSTPSHEMKSWPRKRSLEDPNVDPPAAKRVMNHASSVTSSDASAASSSTLTPSTMNSSAPTSTSITPTFKDYASPWKLPPPQSLVSQAPPHATELGQNHPRLLAGRAMASVFMNSKRSVQKGQLPLLQVPQYQNNQSHMGSGMPAEMGLGCHLSVSQAGQTPSPTAYHFPPHNTCTGLSPSGFPAPRNSPYKPIRRVSTLLFPPQTTSVQQAPQQVSYDQMHYQPLGRPSSERRTGILPHHSFSTWSNNAHQMQHQLPPPTFST